MVAVRAESPRITFVPGPIKDIHSAQLTQEELFALAEHYEKLAHSGTLINPFAALNHAYSLLDVVSRMESMQV